MDLSTIANVATALTVITGVAFGLVEAQRSRRARQERAAYAAVQAILSPEWMKSMIVVHSIPDGLGAAAIEADQPKLPSVRKPIKRDNGLWRGLPPGTTKRTRAFSSEVDTGSREENASK